MSTPSTSAAALPAANLAATSAAAAPSGTTTTATVTTTANAPTTAAATGAQQAAQGAQQVQAQPQAEAFNAPMLDLPPDPSTHEVMNGLAGAMADPSVNKSSADQLYAMHKQLLDAERSMVDAIIAGIQ